MRGETQQKKLIIIAPPGHAKSTWLSLIFPCWYLGNHPDHSLLFLTSSDVMAGQFHGTVAAALAENERHQAVFRGAACRPNVERGWSRDGLYLQGTPSGAKDPAYRAAGWGTSTIGARAHGIILDDPLTQERAQSAVEQASAQRYYDMTVETRLHPDGWVIAIMTRWAENDLAAYLMQRAGWRTIVMPAIGEYPWGPALWPERFSLAWLEAKRAELGGPTFNAVFQGDPTSLGGSVFKEAAWFQPLPSDFDEPRDDGKSLRQRLTIVQFWDLAFSERDGADYTAGVTVGRSATQGLYVLDVARRRMSPIETERAMLEGIVRHRPALVGIEEAAYRQRATLDIAARVQRAALQAGVPCIIVPVKPSRDKVTRALLPAGRAEQGALWCDTKAPWWPVFLSECLAFPLGANDDQVDALSGACQLAIEKGSQQQGIQHGSYSLAGARPPAGPPDLLAQAQAQQFQQVRAQVQEAQQAKPGQTMAERLAAQQQRRIP